MNHSVSLISQSNRKRLDVTDLLCTLPTLWSGTVTPPPYPSNTVPKKCLSLRRITNADLTKSPHNGSSHSDLDLQRCAALLSISTLWLERKINHTNQSSHSIRCLFPPLGSVCKHKPVATVIWMVNTANQVNCKHIYLFYVSCSRFRLLTCPIHYAARANNSTTVYL